VVLQDRSNLGELVDQNVPDDVSVDVVVMVSEPVARSGETLPWNLWVGFLELRGESVGSSAEVDDVVR
jgi:hypothetical protein